uniref:Uncharacterized protein n=1 Tax=Octopus bimaculoides TaxID=37653 RepID=A0A0L8FZA1_OCTBM
MYSLCDKRAIHFLLALLTNTKLAVCIVTFYCSCCVCGVSFLLGSFSVCSGFLGALVDDCGVTRVV